MCGDVCRRILYFCKEIIIIAYSLLDVAYLLSEFLVLIFMYWLAHHYSITLLIFDMQLHK